MVHTDALTSTQRQRGEAAHFVLPVFFHPFNLKYPPWPFHLERGFHQVATAQRMVVSALRTGGQAFRGNSRHSFKALKTVQRYSYIAMEQHQPLFDGPQKDRHSWHVNQIQLQILPKHFLSLQVSSSIGLPSAPILVGVDARPPPHAKDIKHLFANIPMRSKIVAFLHTENQGPLEKPKTALLHCIKGTYKGAFERYRRTAHSALYPLEEHFFRSHGSHCSHAASMHRNIHSHGSHRRDASHRTTVRKFRASFMFHQLKFQRAITPGATYSALALKVHLASAMDLIQLYRAGTKPNPCCG